MPREKVTGDGNPDFNNARGHASTLQMAPPFKFKQVTMSVFPLRANLSRLTNFCNSFLNRTYNNKADVELTRFEPFIPYVYLVILDYGQMAREAANMGWVSQREVAFSIPLRWLVPKNGVWDFHDWAFTSPFIFVDNELSMSTGREVYGWPKTLAHLDAEVSDWIRDPHGARQVFSVSTAVRDLVYQGKTASKRPFLTITHKDVPYFGDIPPDLSGIMKPLTRFPNVAGQVARLSMDLFRTFGGIAMEGITGSPHFPNLLDPDFYKEQLKPEALKRWVSLDAWRPGLDDIVRTMFPRGHANTVNFKQFRDIGSPWEACYQGITNAKMGIDDVSRGGLLGQPNLAFGQLDGGYHINLHRFESLPIVDILGLEVRENSESGGTAVAGLRPTLPFWMQVDMSYARGKTLAWRSRKSHWIPGEGLDEIEDFQPLAPTADFRREMKATPEPPHEGQHPDEVLEKENEEASGDPAMSPMSHLYSTARGAAGTPAGPFIIPDATIRVMPLLADEDVLRTFVADYLNVEDQAHFEPWGNTVYFLAINYSEGMSQVENVGLVRSRELRFAVPVKWYSAHDISKYLRPGKELGAPNAIDTARRDREQLITVALVNPFAYSDEAMVAIARSEVDGVPTLRTELQSPPDKWMSEGGPSPDTGRPLLRTSGVVIPALGVGAGGRHATFLQVTEAGCAPDDDESTWREIARRWGPRLAEDLSRKHGERNGPDGDGAEPSADFERLRSMAAGVMSGHFAMQSLSLKQFRDAWYTDEACYQSLVLERMRFERVHEVHEISHSVHVGLTRFPTQPVAQILGLIPKHTRTGAEGIVDVFEAVRPFWLRGALVQERGLNVFERVGTKKWSVVDKMRLSDLGIDPPTPASDNVTVLESAVLRYIDETHLPSIPAYVDSAIAMGQTKSVSMGEVRESAGRISPATILDSLLSRQWMCPKPLRRRLPKSDFCIPGDFASRRLQGSLFGEWSLQDGYWPASLKAWQRVEAEMSALASQVWMEIWLNIRTIDEIMEELALAALPQLLEQYARSDLAKNMGGRGLSTRDWAKIADWIDEELMELRSTLPLADDAVERKKIADAWRQLGSLGKRARSIQAFFETSPPGSDPETVRTDLMMRLTGLADGQP